jgi:hypothetical protein
MRRRSWLAVLVALTVIVLVLVLIVPTLNPLQSAMNKDLEECEAHATTGTYTFTSFSTTEVSGVNRTVTSVVTTTQVQVCTVSP